MTRRQVEAGGGRRVTDGRITGTLTGQYDRDYDGRSWRWFAMVDLDNGCRSGGWLGELRFV